MAAAVRMVPIGGLATMWSSQVSEHLVATARPEPSADALARLKDADDRALIAAFLSGDRDAFEVIVERHRRQVYQLCYRFLGNHEDASDLTQDVFVRAFKGLRNFKGDSALGTWLYRVGVNACLNRVALKTPKMETLEPEQHVDQRHPDAHELVARGERAAVVRRAIAKLPPKQRATLVLRTYQEMSHEEIAGVLGSSVGAVKANFFHALGNLKRLLQEEPS
ncbi:MAG: RNA polymerase sigma factor [Acidobacteria bacterium]|nr:RNA polymerase sigma factor [Acidobacteriota bacterium]